MRILETSFTDNTKQINAVINSTTLNDVKDNVITVTDYIVYETEEEDKNGEKKTKRLLTFATTTGEAFGTVSENVMESWDFIIATLGEVSEEKPISIKITSAKSKNDREFLQITLC